MATRVFEDVLDLKIGLLEATLPNWADPGDRSPSYPFPTLTATGRDEIRRFGTLLLENEYLRVTAVPALGGRILSLFDKRTGREVLSLGEALLPVRGGLRGVRVAEGIQVQYRAGEDRLNSLGNVDTTAEDEGVWIAESAVGPISHHLFLSMPSERAELQVEVRFFNRSLQSEPYNGALSLYMPESQVLPLEDGVAVYDSKRDVGLVLFWDTPLSVRAEEGSLTVSRFSDVGTLGPRQLDTVRLSVVPLGGLGGLTGAGREGAVFFSPEGVHVQATERRLSHKLLLVTDDGQTLEAPVDIHPEQTIVVPLNGLRPDTLVLRDPGKVDVLRVDVEPRHARETPILPIQNPSTALTLGSNEFDLHSATFDVAQRSTAYTLLAMKALSRREFHEASEYLERALLFNAEDHLSWWLKAFADRSGGEEGERAELLNAHYLAPLEPALRAEAFLAQELGQGKEANPLIAPLAENPENLVEVACLLLGAGLLPEASRWIDEALRHRDLPILHILQAYALKTGTRMDAEAARHVALAKGLKEPPFPWREVEWRVIEAVKM